MRLTSPSDPSPTILWEGFIADRFHICHRLNTARNLAAQALHKAEELVVVAEKKAEETTQGTDAEPMTSNLMQGAKGGIQEAEKKVEQ